MALGATRSSQTSQPMASAMVARPVSSTHSNAADRSSVKGLDFSSGIDVTDKRFLYYGEDQGFEFFDHDGRQKEGTPFIFRSITGFTVSMLDELLAQQDQPVVGTGRPLFAQFLSGIGIYERNSGLETLHERRPGQVFNFLN